MKKVLSIVLATFLFLTSFAVSFETLTPNVVAQTTTRVVRHRRHKRSFWQKHRDKLTVAAGTATGALIGSAVGSKKAAAIGAGVGAGGSALYTYKLRKRHRRVRRY